MSTAKDFKIKNVTISTNGHKELYFDIELEGNANQDYYELRLFNSNRECIECYAYPSSGESITIKSIFLDLNPKEENIRIFYLELGVAEYTDKGEEIKWKMLSAYKPIEVNIYYETHIFRKSVMEIR